MARQPVCVLAALLLLAVPAASEIEFPKLTGRVVDRANLLSASAIGALDERLAAHERASTNQLVVVTLESLDGIPIEEYGYQLGRHWGIGQKGEDNGVLLIVAPNEREVRIEVGYGLEGVLTDAIASNIIHAIVLPAFRRGDMPGGIEQGALAIVEALGGQYAMREAPGGNRRRQSPWTLLPVLFLVGFSLLGSSRLGRGSVFYGPTYGGRWGGGVGRGGFGGGGFGGGGFGGGGFGGGGGGFGGGGASGGW